MMKELIVFYSLAPASSLSRITFFQHHVWSLVILFDRFQFFFVLLKSISVDCMGQKHEYHRTNGFNKLFSNHSIVQASLLAWFRFFLLLKMHDKAKNAKPHYTFEPYEQEVSIVSIIFIDSSFDIFRNSNCNSYTT